MPSSTSRSSASSSASTSAELLLDHGAGAEGLGRADEPAELDHDVVARGDAELEREARREPELVDRVDVRRVGDRDAQRRRPRARTGSRRRARGRGAASPSRPRRPRRSTARSTSGSRKRAARMRAMPSLGATPSSTSACANEPPWWARPRTSASLSGGTRPVAASRSTTSSATALIGMPPPSGCAPLWRPSFADGAERRRCGCSNSFTASIPRTRYRHNRGSRLSTPGG